VLSGDDDAVLDAVGGYVARRGPLADALPEGAPTDASAAGRAREVLLSAADDYALVGTPPTVADRVEDLKDAGADVVVGYPARGIDDFLQ
jgi:alkanesulfonate monooxygenase SsuD/methylene tetrahydromethanopterin reductase-like flavin-dependent oxidoreductase (luciferase family)